MRSLHVVLRCALPLVALVATTAPAFAGGAADQAAAEVLFTEAKKLLAAGDYVHACPKLAESQRLDPGAGTLLNLGDCYEKLGRLASAWGSFKEAETTARTAGDTRRQAEAARRADALTPQPSKLAIVVPPDARVPGFEVRRDGEPVGEGQWGSPMPVDVGNHTIEVAAPGYKKWSTEIRVDVNGAATTVRVQPLEKLPAAPATGGSTWSTQRTVGLVVGGVGLVGAVVGSVFGVQAMSKKSSADMYCSEPMQNVCSAMGVSLRRDEKTAGTVSTAAFVAGGAVLAGGLVVFLTAPTPDQGDRKTALRVSVVPGGAGASVEGSF